MLGGIYERIHWGASADDKRVLLQNAADAATNWRKAQSALDQMPESSVVPGGDAAKKCAELKAVLDHAETQLGHWIGECRGEAIEDAEILKATRLSAKPEHKQSLLARFATWLTVDSPQGLTYQLFVFLLFLFALFLAAFTLLGWAQSCNGKQWLQITVAAFLISAASVGAGCVLGFLFGLPRSIEKAGDPGLHGYLSNTNLLDVSDWLTKIIVGISLVQIGNLPSALGRLGRSIAPMLGYSPQRNPSCAAAVITSESAIGGIGVAMCLSTLVIAFSWGYLFTRVILLRVLRQADTENYGQPRIAG